MTSEQRTEILYLALAYFHQTSTFLLQSKNTKHQTKILLLPPDTFDKMFDINLNEIENRCQ
jgi:hypothetical protein